MDSASASFDHSLSALDLWVVVVYLAATVALGIWLSRRNESPEDFFLAGRSMPWAIVGLSLFASNISSTSLVGLAGDGYSVGISVFNYEWMAALVLAFFAIFFLPFVLRSRVFTMPELLERRYDGRARTYFAILTLFLNIVVDTAGSLYAGGLLVQIIWPQIPIWQSIAALAVAAGVYTAAGGLKAVMITDALQGVILLMSSVLIAFFAFEAAGGWNAVVAAMPPERLSLIRPLDDRGVPWLGVLTGVPLLGFYFWCTNQFMIQRVLSARNIDHGRWGCLFAGALKLPVLFIMVLPGAAAVLLYPDLPQADMVYPTLMLDLLPAGIVGLACAGFLAALMSQIDSTLNGASTLVTMDFVRRWRPDLSAKALTWTGRGATLVFMMLAVLWAPQVVQFESLFRYLQKVLAYAVPPVLSLFLVGLFWARANARGAIWSLWLGTVAGVALFVVNEVYGVIGLHFLYVPPILLAFCSVVLVVGSLVLPADIPASARELIWSPSAYAEDREAQRGRPWYKDYRVHAGVLLGVTALLVVAFW